MSVPPLAVDIDGTLTRPSDDGIDPRIFDPLREWPAPVVIATGKSFPYPIALCQFIGLPERVIAETGGIIHTEDGAQQLSDGDAITAAREAYLAAGHDLGWGGIDTVNRWRETELAIARSQPREPLEQLATEYGLEIVDSGYAYHLKDPAVSKGRGLRELAPLLGLAPEEFVAIGDSANDVSLFDASGRSFAVANAADPAKEAADEVISAPHATGMLQALTRLR